MAAQVKYMGNWDASGNLFPNTDVKAGYLYRVSVGGTIAGVDVEPGAKLLALIDSPGQILSNWDITF